MRTGSRTPSPDRRARWGVAVALLGLLGGLGVGWLVAPPSEPGPRPPRAVRARAPAPVAPARVAAPPAVAARLPDAPAFTCRVSGVPPEPLGELRVRYEVPGARGRGEPRWTPRWTAEGDLILPDPPDGAVALHLDAAGLLPAEVALVDGACDGPIPLERAVRVTGVVLGLPVGARAWVEGCEARASVEGDRFVLDAPPGATCTYVATREDGAFRARSGPVTVVVSPHHGAEIELVLPAAATAGIGAALEETPEGVRLARLRRDGAGAAAGLLPGDLVVAVDGESVVGWSGEDFQDVVLGEAGAEVELRVARAGGTRVVRVRRAELDDGTEEVVRERPDGTTVVRRRPRPGLWLEAPPAAADAAQ